MAKGREPINYALSFDLAIFITLSLFMICNCQNPYVPQETVDFWAQQIGRKAYDVATNVMATDEIAARYKSQNIEITQVDGKTLAAELANKMEQFFNGKVLALRSLAIEAEKAKLKFVDDGKSLEYYNAKALKGVDLTYDPTYDTKINVSKSVVHIPLEVYDEDPKVANDIKWTKTLNQVFIDNDKKYPGLSWQYFGSAEGVHRQYPAREWPPPPPGKPDLYDARRRPWYIQGASSPKDVVILIDKSGSLLGLRAEIAKLAATVIVDTLSTNDFFHVVLFNNRTQLVCCDRNLLQATRGKKEYVKEELKDLKPTGTSNWKAGLTEGFQILKENKDADRGTGCQQALIIISDGSAVYDEDVFEKYNSDKKIRVFTFVVGPPQYGIQELRDMACENKGHFLRIPSVGAVWETVTTYIRVLSRPVGSSANKPTVFTSVFVDATGGGLVSTGSTPVFENSNQSDSKLLGVMATDVLVKDLSEFIPIPLIGHNGYLFAIDNNGLILVHPGINGEKLGFLVPQPNMDLDEMEFPVANHSLVEELREKMILSSGGSMVFETYIKSSDELRVRRQSTSYNFVRSKSSPFSIGVASPKYGYMISKPKIDIQKGREALESVDKIKHWPYCPKVRNQRDIKASLVKKMKDGGAELNKCDSRLLNGLLLDAIATDGIEGVWRTKEGISQNYGIDNVFLRTNWGILRTSNGSIPHSENITFSKEIDLAVAPWDYYSRVVRQPDGRILVSIPPNTDNKKSYTPRITIYAPIKLTSPVIKVAVSGMEMPHSTFSSEFFTKETLNCRGGVLCDPRLTCKRDQMNEIEGLYCYLLDENAFVVSSNQDRDSGKFFGSVDSQVMLKLIRSEKSSAKGIFDAIQLPDYQASCRLNPGNPSSASRFFNPMFSLLNMVTWGVTTTISLLSMFTSSTIVSSSTSGSVRYLNCVKNTTVYTAAPPDVSPLRFSGNATCSDGFCRRNFLVSSVPQTNLYLVVVESTCGKCQTTNISDLPGIPGIQKEVVYNKTYFTQPLNNTKPRRRPEYCFKPGKDESSECGGCAGVRASFCMILFLVSFIWLLHDNTAI